MVDDGSRLIIPGASWEMLKKIISAYHAVSDQENPGVDDVAEIAGKPRTLVSSCNGFLRSMGILRTDENKLSEVGTKFALGISHQNDEITREALEEVVRQSQSLARLVAIVRARGSMKLEALRGAIIVAAGLSKDARNVVFVRSIIDMLAESGLMVFDDDTVFPTRTAERPQPEPSNRSEQAEDYRSADTPPSDVPIAPKGYIPTPFPLGPNRLAYLSLPGDWSRSELPRLLKMIELALGEG
jgi:hypothetical protein